MIDIKVLFHLDRWQITPKKVGSGWNKYLSFTFLFLTLTLDWNRIPEGLAPKPANSNN